MFVELIQAFVMIFIAEMGDKTQILAMAFSTKYPIKKVLIGVFLGSLLNHSLAVILGSNLSRVVPLNTISIIAGFSFILFALWNLKFEEDDEEMKSSNKGAIYTVALAFFIGELGDKTQLTAIALSADASYPVFILMGTVLGMVLTSLIGIIIGRKIGDRVDEFYIKIIASCVFLLFGYIKLVSSLPVEVLSTFNVSMFSIIVLVLSYVILRPTLVLRNENRVTLYQLTARKLNEYAKKLQSDIESICLGPDICGDCEKETCPIGQSKVLLMKLDYKERYNDIVKKQNIDKDFDTKVVEKTYLDLLDFLQEHWNELNYKSAHEIRKNLELILFGEYFTFKNYEKHVEKIKEKTQDTYKMFSEDLK